MPNSGRDFAALSPALMAVGRAAMLAILGGSPACSVFRSFRRAQTIPRQVSTRAGCGSPTIPISVWRPRTFTSASRKSASFIASRIRAVAISARWLASRPWRAAMSLLVVIIVGLLMGISFGFALEKSRALEPGMIVGQM